MADVKLQNQILQLGKLIVNELGLTNSNDTLSRWVAHYIAEQIQAIEIFDNDQTNEEQKKMEKCFKDIIFLWQNRGVFPQGKKPTNNFDLIFDTLEKLNRNYPRKYFVEQIQWLENPKTNVINEEIDISILLNYVAEVEKISFFLISDLISRASDLATDEKVKEWIDVTANSYFLDGPDMSAVRFIIDDLNKNFKSEEEKNLKLLINNIDQFIETSNEIKNILKFQLDNILEKNE